MGPRSGSQVAAEFISRPFSTFRAGVRRTSWRTACFFSALQEETRIPNGSMHDFHGRNGLNHADTGKLEIGRVQTSGASADIRRSRSRVTRRESRSQRCRNNELHNRAATRNFRDRQRHCERQPSRRVGRRHRRRKGSTRPATVHRRGDHSPSRPRLRSLLERNGRSNEIAPRIAISSDRRLTPKNRGDQRYRASRLGSPQHEQCRRRTPRRRPLTLERTNYQRRVRSLD